MSAPGGVNLHPSLTVNAFQDGKYCPNGSRGEGESPLIACAKVNYVLVFLLYCGV